MTVQLTAKVKPSEHMFISTEIPESHASRTNLYRSTQPVHLFAAASLSPLFASSVEINNVR